MKIAGIVAEYNPFHNGHAFLVEKVREAGAECVVAVMSGSFVQRGEPSVFDFETRVRAALCGGVDLVIGLPSIYAVSGAERFAGAAVETLDALGVVDTLAFGSECGDINALIRAADSLRDERLPEYLKRELATGISFARARERALMLIDPKSASLLASPNDILGIEYISALKRISSDMTPFAVARIGAEHDGGEVRGEFASASKIRELIRSGEDISCYVPKEAAEIYAEKEPSDIRFIERAVLYKMRTVTPSELANVPDISEGIENRIIAAAKRARTLDELYSLAKTKRYPHARIRRIVLNCFLGVTESLAATSPAYIRVGGFTPRGAQLLREATDSARLPVLAKTADVSELGEKGRAIFASECTAGDIYSLCFANAGECGNEKRFHPVALK